MIVWGCSKNEKYMVILEIKMQKGQMNYDLLVYSRMASGATKLAFLSQQPSCFR